MTLPLNPKGEIREAKRDGAFVWQLRCPECGKWADLDDDQMHGRVSVDHTHEGCTFHETRDWWNTADVLPIAGRRSYKLPTRYQQKEKE
jgi:hypothetical protein